MSGPDFDKIAEIWLTQLEREYWEESRCRCKAMLAELLKRAYTHTCEDLECGLEKAIDEIKRSIDK